MIEGNTTNTNPSLKKALDAITQVTTRVSTTLLQRNGIQNIRVLSESQFLDLLRRMQARKNLVKTGDPDGFGLADELHADVAKAYEARWTDLRAKHEQSLTQIEGRMEKLSRAFSGIHGVVEKLEKKPETKAALAESPAAQSAGEALKQRSLLRQLLLTGDESRA